MFSLRRGTSSPSENSKKLTFASMRVVTLARIFAQARVVSPKRESVA